MKRRQFALGVGAGITLLAGCTSARVREAQQMAEEYTDDDQPTNQSENMTEAIDGGSNTQPVTVHYGDRPISYTHEQLRLRAHSEAVQIGQTIAFEVTNTGDDVVTLGCNNPWTIQKYVNDQWRDLLVTSATGFAACASPLQAGESVVEHVVLSKSALENESDSLQFELTASKYRFVLLSSAPFLAADFSVTQ